MNSEGASKYRRHVRVATIAVILALSGVICVGLYQDGALEVSPTEGTTVTRDGADLVYEGDVTVRNPYFWTMTGMTVGVGLEDNLLHKTYDLWTSDAFDVPPGHTVSIHVSFRFPLTVFCGAVLNSVDSDGSFVSMSTVVKGNVMFGLFDVSGTTHTGVRLADDGEKIVYTSTVNDNHTYGLRVENLREGLLPSDVDAVFTGAAGDVSLRIQVTDGVVFITMSSAAKLDECVDRIYEDGYTVTGIPQGYDGDALVSLMYGLSYARWFV